MSSSNRPKNSDPVEKRKTPATAATPAPESTKRRLVEPESKPVNPSAIMSSLAVFFSPSWVDGNSENQRPHIRSLNLMFNKERDLSQSLYNHSQSQSSTSQPSQETEILSISSNAPTPVLSDGSQTPTPQLRRSPRLMERSASTGDISTSTQQPRSASFKK